VGHWIVAVAGGVVLTGIAVYLLTTRQQLGVLRRRQA
jgi:hypothetical protein